MQKHTRIHKLLATLTFTLAIGTAPLAFAESAGQYVDDATITAKLKAALIADKQLKALQISVETSQGTVQLTGTVDTKDEEAEAVKVANRVAGVKAVKDLLDVRITQ